MILEILKLVLSGPFEFISFMILLVTIHVLFHTNITQIINLYFEKKTASATAVLEKQAALAAGN
jgi:hypothetical protein